jgi:proline dehydrogenase
VAVHGARLCGVLRRRLLFTLATSGAFERVAPKRRAWRSARRYVAGETLEDALDAVERLNHAGLNASVDLFGERTGAAETPAVAAAYERLCARLPAGAWVSLDLSHIAFDGALLDRIVAALPPDARLQVGAEEGARADRVLDLVTARGAPLEATLQANLLRSPRDAVRLAAAGVSVRLVKGAYVERESHPWGEATDRAFAELAQSLDSDGVDVALATQDERLQDVLPHARVELLLGVRPELARRLAAQGRDVRIYVPYGADWFRYFMRRRAEAQGAA